MYALIDTTTVCRTVNDVTTILDLDLPEDRSSCLVDALNRLESGPSEAWAFQDIMSTSGEGQPVSVLVDRLICTHDPYAAIGLTLMDSTIMVTGPVKHDMAIAHLLPGTSDSAAVTPIVADACATWALAVERTDLSNRVATIIDLARVHLGDAAADIYDRFVTGLTALIAQLDGVDDAALDEVADSTALIESRARVLGLSDEARQIDTHLDVLRSEQRRRAQVADHDLAVSRLDALLNQAQNLIR